MGWPPSLRPPSLIITTSIILIYLATRLLLFLFSSFLPSTTPTPLIRPPRPSSLRPSRPENTELAPKLVALAQETNSLLRVLIGLRTGNREDATETDQDASEDEGSEDEGPPNLVNITSERMRRYNTTMFQWAWVNHPELYQSPGLDSKEQSGLQRRRLSCLPRIPFPPLSCAFLSPNWLVVTAHLLLVLSCFGFSKVDQIVKVQFISFFRRSFYTNQNKSKILQCSEFLWLQIKILRCASLGLIRSSVKWSCDFLGGINPPICYTQPNCCVGRVILCKMPYGRQML